MNRIFLRSCLATLPLALAACTAPAPNLEANFGRSMTDIVHAQTLNPGAGADMRNPAGMAGNAAHAGYQRYEKSYKAPEPQNNAFTIGVGK